MSIKFPTIATAYSEMPKRMANFEKAVATFEAAMAAGAIPNPTFIDAKDDISRAVEAGWDVITRQMPRDNSAVQAARWDLSDPYSGVAAFVRSNIKKLAKTPDDPFFSLVRAYIEEVRPLADLIGGLKDKIVKRQPKPVEDRKAKYAAPVAGRTAIGQVKALMEEVTVGAHNELKAHWVNVFTRKLNLYLTVQEKVNAADKSISPYGVFGDRRSEYFSPDVSSIVDRMTKDGGRITVVVDGKEKSVQKFEALPNAAEIVDEAAGKIADEVRENFVYKNLEKLDSIVDVKSDLVKGEVIGREISLGGLRGTLRFYFSDGAAFTVQNSVVWSTSVHGLSFQRFPLTFHDVVLAGGKKMGRPSEERMNTVFVKGGEG